jgi:hypothetical protein
MNALGTRIALVALASMLASASPAFGEETSGELLPPGNSAANQYTEAFPTARGGQDPEQSEGKPRKGSSLQALGARNVRRLEAEGAEGRAAAELAAATAPSTVDSVDSLPETAPTEPRRDAKPAADKKPHRATKEPTVDVETAVVVAAADVDPPSGASGLSEVIGQATGSSASGGLGLWLPLIFIGVLGWAGGYTWSRRGTARQPG